MYTTINEYSFVQGFDDMERGNNFSVEARAALFAYYEELEEDTGKSIEYDPIAICCDWTEYGNAIEAAADYGFTPDDDDDEDEQCEAAREFLEDHYTVIELSYGGVLVSE